MVRCANRSKQRKAFSRVRLRAEPTIFPSGSLHAPYGPMGAPGVTHNGPLTADFLPSFRLPYTFHPEEWKPLFFPQFFQGRKQRYPSCGESESRYTTWKITEKPEEESILGKFGKNPPSELSSLATCAGERVGRDRTSR